MTASATPKKTQAPAARTVRADAQRNLDALLEAAKAVFRTSGVDDIEAYDLLRAVGNLTITAGEDGAGQSGRMVDLLIDGLRYGARATSGPSKKKQLPR